MKARTIILFIAAFALIIAGSFMDIQHADGGGFLQGLGSGALIGALLNIFSEWKEKKATQKSITP